MLYQTYFKLILNRRSEVAHMLTKRKVLTCVFRSLCTYLCHLVTFAFPAETFIVQRVLVGTDEDGFPVDVVAYTLTNMEHVQTRRDVGRDPLLRLGDIVAAWTQLLMKWDSCAIL